MLPIGSSAISDRRQACHSVSWLTLLLHRHNMLENLDAFRPTSLQLGPPRLFPIGFEALPYTFGFFSLTHCADGFNILLYERMIPPEISFSHIKESCYWHFPWFVIAYQQNLASIRSYNVSVGSPTLCQLAGFWLHLQVCFRFIVGITS